MSAHLNTLAGTIYEDFLRKHMPKKSTDSQANTIIKATVIICGFICTTLVFLVERMGGVLQVSSAFAGGAAGPLLGLFTLGMLFPSVTTKGALYGSLASLATMTWIIAGFQYNIVKKSFMYDHKPLSVEKCDNFTQTISNATRTFLNEEPFILFRISFYWYPIIGAFIVIFVGLLVTWISKEENPKKYDKDLYSPVIHRLVPKRYDIISQHIHNKEEK